MNGLRDARHIVMPEDKATYDPNADPDLLRLIEEGLDMIRPYLMADGGSVRLLNITDDLVVELELSRRTDPPSTCRCSASSRTWPFLRRRTFRIVNTTSSARVGRGVWP